MKVLAAIAACVALSVACGPAFAGEHTGAKSARSTHSSTTPDYELHFTTVLTLHGEIVAVDPAKRLVTVKGPSEVLTLEARSEKELAAYKAGEHVVVRYFEGGLVAKERPGEGTPARSLKEGMIVAEGGGPSAKRHALVALVDRVDAAEQEITLKGRDGSLETIMVVNPEELQHIKAGEQVIIRRGHGLALSIEREG